MKKWTQCETYKRWNFCQSSKFPLSSNISYHSEDIFASIYFYFASSIFFYADFFRSVWNTNTMASVLIFLKIETVSWDDHFLLIEIHYNGTKIKISQSPHSQTKSPPKHEIQHVFSLSLFVLWMRNIDSIYNKWTWATTCVTMAILWKKK